MKLGLLILISICCFIPARAWQDSIQVVIECDSLYRPFLECSTVKMKIGLNDDYGTVIRLDSNLSFMAPLPKGSEAFCIISIYSILNNKAFLIIRKSDSLLNKKILSFPADCEFNKSMINNTCSNCHSKDSVTWIQYGLGMSNIIHEESYLPKICNPYKNPINSKGYSGGCTTEDCQPHWYCHRCKKEY